MKATKRFAWATLAAALMAAGVTLMGFTGLDRLERRTSEVNAIVRNKDFLKDLETSLMRFSHALHEYTIESSYEERGRALEDFLDYQQRLGSLETKEEFGQAELLRNLRVDLPAFQAAAMEYFNQNPGRPETQNIVERHLQNALSLVTKAWQNDAEKVDTALRNLEKLELNFRMLSVLVLLMLGMGAAWGMVNAHRRVIGPLVNLAAEGRKLALGKLDVSIRASGDIVRFAALLPRDLPGASFQMPRSRFHND